MTDPIGGHVHIANDVLADLAGFTALECYGVVGMASTSLIDGVAKILHDRNCAHIAHQVVVTKSSPSFYEEDIMVPYTLYFIDDIFHVPRSEKLPFFHFYR